MNARQFSERCNVTPQVVRMWLRTGKVVRAKSGFLPSDDYILLPRLVIRSGNGTKQARTDTAGVSERTLRNWVRTGRVRIDGDYIMCEEGCHFELTYRPALRKHGEKSPIGKDEHGSI